MKRVRILEGYEPLDGVGGRGRLDAYCVDRWLADSDYRPGTRYQMLCGRADYVRINPAIAGVQRMFREHVDAWCYMCVFRTGENGLWQFRVILRLDPGETPTPGASVMDVRAAVAIICATDAFIQTTEILMEEREKS